MLQLDMHFLNILLILISLLYKLLQLSHAHILLMNFSSMFFSRPQLIGFFISVFGDMLGVSFMSTSCKVTEYLPLIDSHFILIVLSLLSLKITLKISALVLQVVPNFLSIFGLLLGLKKLLLYFRFIFISLFVKFSCLVSNCVNLTLENELFADNVKLDLIEFLLLFVKVSLHLSVLNLEQINVLVGSLFIIKETSNAALFLIFYDFFFQNFEFELHEVDLLLKISNILILYG